MKSIAVRMFEDCVYLAVIRIHLIVHKVSIYDVLKGRDIQRKKDGAKHEALWDTMNE